MLINNIKQEKNTFAEAINVDLLRRSFSTTTGNQILDILGKCVLFAAGFNPFKFITNDASEGKKPLLDLASAPSIEDLITNRK